MAGGVVHMQNIEHSLVFVGRKPFVLATPEAVNFQWGRVINIGGKKELKKRTHGTRKQGQKRSIFEANMAPKMDPGGFQKRVHKTVGN